jgi:hypothetical protein
MEEKPEVNNIIRSISSQSKISSSKSNELNSISSTDITYKNNFQNIFTKKNKKIYISIITYLEYKDILSLQLINKTFYSLLHSSSLAKLYALNGLINTSENRLLFYEANINIQKMFNTLKKELVDYKVESKIFENILKIAEGSKSTNKKFSHVCDEINRDINRTFYTEKFVEGNGKKMLIDILTALAFIRPEIGYCQGMNFIAGALINCIDNEEKCFWIFLSFIDNIEMNLLYLKNMPDYSIRVYQLNSFIKEYFPDLANHFKKNQINPDVFFSKWILTIFSNYLPFEVLYKVWDVFIFDKWKAIFKFSLMILNTMKDKLIKMDLITFSQFIKDNKNNSDFINFDEFSKHYKDYKITNRQLNELREEFFIDQVKKKIESADSEWETDQSDYVNNYKKELEEHLNNFKTLIDQLKDEIGKVNIEYERKSKKYEEKLKKVNELKMKLETQIEIKTGYEKVLSRFSENNGNSDGNGDNVNNNNNKNPEKEDNNANNNDINKNYKKNLSKDEKGHKKLKFSFIRSKSNVSEYDKLQKKLHTLMKDIDVNNKSLLEQYKKLDKKKISLEKVTKTKERLIKQLNDIVQNSEKIKKELLKNLSEKLKLTAKFVSTNQY